VVRSQCATRHSLDGSSRSVVDARSAAPRSGRARCARVIGVEDFRRFHPRSMFLGKFSRFFWKFFWGSRRRCSLCAVRTTPRHRIKVVHRLSRPGLAVEHSFNRQCLQGFPEVSHFPRGFRERTRESSRSWCSASQSVAIRVVERQMTVAQKRFGMAEMLAICLATNSDGARRLSDSEKVR